MRKKFEKEIPGLEKKLRAVVRLVGVKRAREITDEIAAEARAPLAKTRPRETIAPPKVVNS